MAEVARGHLTILGVFGDVAQEERPGAGAVHGERDRAELCLVGILEVERLERSRDGRHAEVIPQGQPHRVTQQRVALGHAVKKIEERTEVARARVLPQSIGGRTPGKRIRVAETSGGEPGVARRPVRRLREDAQGVNSHLRVVVRGRGFQHLGGQLSHAVENPEGVGSGVSALTRPHRTGGGRRGALADLVDESGHRQGAVRQTRVLEGLDQLVRGAAGEARRPARRLRERVRAGVDHPPDATAVAITARVSERHLVVTDDPVVEVCDVERAVWSDPQVDGTKPRIFRADEIFLFVGRDGRAVVDERVAVHSTRPDVADEQASPELRRKVLIGVVRDAADGGGSVVMRHHRRHEAEPVVGLPEARVVAAAEELSERQAVAVGREQVAESVVRHTERIHLTPGVLLDARPVDAHAIGVPGLKGDAAPVRAVDRALVVETMADVKPAVERTAKGVVEAVGVALPADRPVENLALVGASVSVVIDQVVEVGDAEGDGSTPVGIDTDRNVESIREGAHAIGAAVTVGVLEDLDRVASRLSRLEGKRILGRTRDPEAATLVEGEVHGFRDVRLGDDELDLEAGGQLEGFPLGLGGERIRAADVLGEGVDLLGEAQRRDQDREDAREGSRPAGDGRIGQL